jgi:TPR repeat protein
MRLPFRLTGMILLVTILLGSGYFFLAPNISAKDFSLKFLHLKAALGHAPSQSKLGIIYNDGAGVPQDYKEAMEWLRKAADQGVAEAQYGLGVMYHNGMGIPQDNKEAEKWYGKAANQGVAVAQFWLGLMYINGEGIPQDYVKAYAWLNLAAVQGEEQAANIRALLLEEIAPEEIAEGKKLSAQLHEKIESSK